MDTDEIVVMKLAVEKFGPESQIDMAIEECAELINALCKLRRQRVGPIDVVTEIADVQISVDNLHICSAKRPWKMKGNERLHG